MSEVLEDYKRFSRLTEVYEVVQTVHVVIEGPRVIRIEVLKCYSNPAFRYTVRYWRLESHYLQSSSRIDGEFEKEPEDKRILSEDLRYPFIYADTQEGALRQALSYVGD